MSKSPTKAHLRVKLRSRLNAHARRASTGKQHRPIRRGRLHPLIKIQRLWHRLPLSKRLVLITTSLLTIGLLIASLAVTSLLYTHLLNQIDDQLRVTSQAIGYQGLAQMRTGNSSTMPSTYYVQAQYVDGQERAMLSDDTAAEYGTPQIGTLNLQDAIDNADDPKIFTVNSDLAAHQWRVIALPFKNAETGEYRGVVAIALPLSTMMETVTRTRLIVITADVSVIVLGTIVAFYLVNRSFRSLRQIENVSRRIASGDLSARVPLSEPASTEVGSLQRALNTMLTQNEQAFSVQVVAQERMQRFISDASHELRTPLAAIRGYGELYRMGGVPAEREPEVMGRIESEASRMGRLVDDLLQLARMDEGRQLAMSTVNLTEICRGALADMMVLAPDRKCELLPFTDASATTTPSKPGAAAANDAAREPIDVLVTGDKDRLSQVITNLLGNVTRHTPAGTPVEIAVGTIASADPTLSPPIAVVEVRDHGPGVPESEAKKVFERFYRADTSRNRETGGSGLGLAIVATIIARHGGDVRMQQTPGGGATVHIELPAQA